VRREGRGGRRGGEGAEVVEADAEGSKCRLERGCEGAREREELRDKPAPISSSPAALAVVVVLLLVLHHHSHTQPCSPLSAPLPSAPLPPARPSPSALPSRRPASTTRRCAPPPPPLAEANLRALPDSLYPSLLQVIDHYERPRNVSLPLHRVTQPRAKRSSELVIESRGGEPVSRASSAPLRSFAVSECSRVALACPARTSKPRVREDDVLTLSLSSSLSSPLAFASLPLPQVGSLDKNDVNVGSGLVGAPACGDGASRSLPLRGDPALTLSSSSSPLPPPPSLPLAPLALLRSHEAHDQGRRQRRHLGRQVQDVRLRLRHRLVVLHDRARPRPHARRGWRHQEHRDCQRINASTGQAALLYARVRRLRTRPHLVADPEEDPSLTRAPPCPPAARTPSRPPSRTTARRRPRPTAR